MYSGTPQKVKKIQIENEQKNFLLHVHFQSVKKFGF